MAQQTNQPPEPGSGPDYGDMLDFGDGVLIPRSTGPEKPDSEVERVSYQDIPPFPENEDQRPEG